MSNPSTTLLTQTSVDIYGAARLGAASLAREVSAGVSNITFVGVPVYDSSVIDQRIASANYAVSQLPEVPAVHERWLGYKQYELSNHLGNVTATLSDAKSTHYDGAVHYTPRITSLTDYYPFGSAMPGRSFSEGEYRYGFGGHEKDDDICGSGNSYSFGDMGYSPRIGRRWKIDPVVKEQESPYASFGNSPVWLVDQNGLDTLVVHRSRDFELIGMTKLYTLTFSIIKDGVQTKMQDSPQMWLIANAEAEKRGDNGLTKKKYYTMSQGNMSSSDGKAREIRVTDFGIFIHAGSTVGNFNGCMGISCLPPVIPWNNGSETYEAAIMGTGDLIYSEGWENIVKNITDTKNYGERDENGNIKGGLMTMWDLYDHANGPTGDALTGDKFLLQPNSDAPMEGLKPMSPSTTQSPGSSERTIQTR